MKSLGNDDYITFYPDNHTYYDADGVCYTSMSKTLSSIKEEFDAEKISYMCARKEERLRIHPQWVKGMPEADAKKVKERQLSLKAEWKATNTEAIDHGNWIHNALEGYFKTGTIEPELEALALDIGLDFKHYYKSYNEVILYSKKYEIAGQTDKIGIRQRSSSSVVDFFDYKTNKSKGIKFDSITKDGKHINKFLYPPLEHLEACNYNEYAMQLGGYAYMAEETYGIRVGRLAIIFIDADFKKHIMPVPYLRADVISLFESYKNAKPLPVAAAVVSDYKHDEKDMEIAGEEEW